MAAPTPTDRKFLGRLPLPERTFVADALRAETIGGVVLLAAAVAALIWANTPLGDSYESVRNFRIGPSALGLDLSIQHWAADGLLAVFFFVAGIELKRELVAGELRDPKAAALPVIAAICGMAMPALVYVLVATTGGGSAAGWAVPTATDIAFALAVLAVIGTSLPSALRAFLLTLAVVDDLFAILIIAVFFTSDLNFAALGGAVIGLGAFWLLLRKGIRGWYVYVPLALVIWGLMYNSGVHATIAGVAMGLMLRCTKHKEEEHSPGSASSTSYGRCRQDSPYRCSRSSPRVSRSPATRSPTSSPSPRPSVSSSAWWSARPSGSSAAPGSRRASPAPSSMTIWPGLTSSPSPRSPASASPSRCSSANWPSPATRC